MSPSDMLDDDTLNIGRVIAIEAQLDQMRNQNEATHQLLQDVLDKFSSVTKPFATCSAEVDLDLPRSKQKLLEALLPP